VTSSLPADELALPQTHQQLRRVGGELLAVDIGGGIVAGRGATSAYLFGPERNGAPRLLYHLLSEGYASRCRRSPSTPAGDIGRANVRRARRATTLRSAAGSTFARESGGRRGRQLAQAGVGQYGIGLNP
jgi:hypothetical protein